MCSGSLRWSTEGLRMALALRGEAAHHVEQRRPLALLRGLQDLELALGQVLLDRLLHKRAELVRLDCVQLDADAAAEPLGAAVARLGGARRQVPVLDLLRGDGEP